MNYGNDANSALSMYRGVSSGTPQGYAGAAANGAKLYGDVSGNPAVAGAGGAALGGLGLYSGIQQGGVAGDTEAAAAAAQIGQYAAQEAGAQGAASALGSVALPLGMVAQVAMDLTTPAYTLNPSYYKNMNSALSQGPGPAYRRNYSASPQDLNREGQFWGSMVEAGTSDDPIEHAMLQAYGLPKVTPALQNTQQYQSVVPAAAHGSAGTYHLGRMARGGTMSAQKINSRLARLKSIIAGRPYSQRQPRHFDGGGYVNYAPPAYISSSWSPSTNFVDIPSDTYSTFNNEDIFPATQDSSAPIDTNNLVSSGVSGEGDYGSSNDPTSSSSGGSGAGGVASAIGSFLRQYGALAPILGAAFGSNKPASAPATPAGYGAIPSIPTPNINRSYTQPNVANWYTYGQGPEQSFYSNNQLPYIPGVSPSNAQQYGQGTTGTTASQVWNQLGGNTLPSGTGALPIKRAQGGDTFDSTQGDDYVHDQGHGDGTSDPINAKLSPGEYVWDANTTALAGNGSNAAGARALDQLRQKLWKDAGKRLGKGKQFMKAKPLHQYLPKGTPGSGGNP